MRYGGDELFGDPELLCEFLLGEGQGTELMMIGSFSEYGGGTSVSVG